MKRQAPGIYRDETALISRVAPEARAAGYSDGWHLYINEQYCDTFATLGDAREALIEARA